MVENCAISFSFVFVSFDGVSSGFVPFGVVVWLFWLFAELSKFDVLELELVLEFVLFSVFTADYLMWCITHGRGHSQKATWTTLRFLFGACA